MNLSIYSMLLLSSGLPGGMICDVMRKTMLCSAGDYTRGGFKKSSRTCILYNVYIRPNVSKLILDFCPPNPVLCDAFSNEVN